MGTWRQELKLRPWMTAAYWFAPPGLLSLLSYAHRATCPGVTPPTVVWVILHPSLIKGMPSGRKKQMGLCEFKVQHGQCSQSTFCGRSGEAGDSVSFQRSSLDRRVGAVTMWGTEEGAEGQLQHRPGESVDRHTVRGQLSSCCWQEIF